MSTSLNPLRRLQPLLSANSANDVRTQQSVDASERRPRKNTSAACEPCRKRRSKCNGGRPVCSTCSARGTSCEYRTSSTETHSQALKRKFGELQNDQNAYEELFDILRSRPEPEALAILDRIRSGVDIQTILRHVKDGDLLLQLSLIPETRYRYEFPYIADMPAFLALPHNPYLASLIYENTFTLITAKQTPVDSRDGTAEYQNMYLTPYHAAKIIDRRLDAATVSQWTAVLADDVMLRRLLESYFMFEFPSLPFFHKDSFLDDMVAGRRRFCSSLLVNAVLAGACHGYDGIKHRADCWNPWNLGYRFLAEAKRLLECEKPPWKITTIQATAIIHLCCDKNGIDKVGWSYLERAISMANEINLFAKSGNEESEKWQKVRTVTAWSFFTYQIIICYYFFKPPLLRNPPEMPLPDPSDSTYYGEIWVKYPLARLAFPINFGVAFKVAADLRVIMNDIACHFAGDATPGNRMNLEQTVKIYSRLKSWYDGLPEPFTASKIVLPDQLILHMQYHNILIAIFEPFAAVESSNLGTSSDDHVMAMDSTPQEIVANSRACLETILRLYYLRHGFGSLDLVLCQYLMLVGFNSLKDLSTPGLAPATRDSKLSTVILCAKGFMEQARNFYLAEAVFHVLRDSMDPSDVRALRDSTKIEEEEERKKLIARHVKSDWPINVVSIAQDPEEHRLGNLIQAKESVETDSSSARSTPGPI